MATGRFSHVLPNLSERQAKYLRSLLQKKYRDREGIFLAEGVRLCEEALDAPVILKQAIVSNSALEHDRIRACVYSCLDQNIEVFSSTERQFKSISDESSPQGIVLVIQKPHAPHVPRKKDNVVLMLDALQDPGNLGTILRSAEWFGIQTIISGKGCVELYNPKVVRSAMGAVFRCAVLEQAHLDHQLNVCKSMGFRILGAVLHGSQELKHIRASGHDVLVIGNEANGISDSLSPYLDETVSIPQKGAGESLNAAVAAAIFMYHLTV